VNPQQQFPVTWPAHPVVARAYLDQLARADAMPAETRTRIAGVLDQAAISVDSGGKDAGVAGQLRALADAVEVSGSGPAARSRAGLKETLAGIAARIS